MSKQNKAQIEVRKKLCRNMKLLVKVCLVLLLTTGCKKSEEEIQLEEFLRTHYPATKVEIICISETDSIYDPFNAVSDMLRNGNYHTDERPTLDPILDDSQNSKNAIGRIAKVKVPFKSFEQNIKVTYDKNGNIVHTSLETELMIEHIWDFWREWKRRDDFLLWR